jgi:hypothetical protein
VQEESQEYENGTQAPEPVYWSAATLEKAVARALAKNGVTRSGTMDAETERCMRSVHAHIRKAHEDLSDLLDDDDDNDEKDDDDKDDDNERALRMRKIKFLQLKAKI